MPRSISLKIITIIMLSVVPVAGASAPTVTYDIDPDTEFQTIDCFGASDAWSMNTIGLWPEERRQAVADLLFSLNTDASGQPEGIGLSMWRFNIGAGSEYQGDSSLINQGTRTECMLMPDGSFDPMRQAGQRNFLTMARRHGVEHFLGFFNSPPVNYTINGLATNTGRDGTFNLRPEHYGDFARFMADVVESLQKTDSVTLDYICPVNEPDGSWNWLGPKQEGTPATNREVARIARLAAAEMTGRNLPTRILINESSDYRCMTGIHQTDWQRGNHISTFFNPDSTATYLGDTPGIERMMAAHSYWTNTPVNKMGGYRTALRDSMARYGVKLWQTELCIMGNDTEIGGGVPYDRTMKTALYIARVIHHDLVTADASSWQWWRAVGGNYRDGLLMRYRPDGAECDTVVDSKLLWTLGNYSRFIRPGARRIGVSTNSPSTPTDPWGVMVSAYRNADGSYVIVAVNYADESRYCSFPFTTQATEPTAWIHYRTSATPCENLAPVAASTTLSEVVLPPRSVTTLVSTLQ